jgi:hypothetical protein
MTIQITLPFRLRSPNVKVHWTIAYKKAKPQLQALRYMLKARVMPSLPVRVILTRVGPKKLDFDNLVFAFKPFRDEIADFLIPGLASGQADSSDEINWIYRQEIMKNYEIQIIIQKDIPKDLKNCFEGTGVTSENYKQMLHDNPVQLILEKIILH